MASLAGRRGRRGALRVHGQPRERGVRSLQSLEAGVPRGLLDRIPLDLLGGCGRLLLKIDSLHETRYDSIQNRGYR